MAALADVTVLLRPTRERCRGCGDEVLVVELRDGSTARLEVNELEGWEQAGERFAVDEDGQAFRLGAGGLGRQRREGEAIHGRHRCAATLRAG